MAGSFCMVKTVVRSKGCIKETSLKPDLWDLVAGAFCMIKNVLGSKMDR